MPEPPFSPLPYKEFENVTQSSWAGYEACIVTRSHHGTVLPSLFGFPLWWPIDRVWPAFDQFTLSPSYSLQQRLG